MSQTTISSSLPSFPPSVRCNKSHFGGRARFCRSKFELTMSDEECVAPRCLSLSLAYLTIIHITLSPSQFPGAAAQEESKAAEGQRVQFCHPSQGRHALTRGRRNYHSERHSRGSNGAHHAGRYRAFLRWIIEISMSHAIVEIPTRSGCDIISSHHTVFSPLLRPGFSEGCFCCG